MFVCNIAAQWAAVTLIVVARGITMPSCSALSNMNFFNFFFPYRNNRASEASTPTCRGDTFGKELARRSQVWLIGVEPRLRGATVEGESSASHE
jgi:hypothetical protein